MQEFWLGILKNIVTYLVVLVIAFVGLVSLTSGEFPPSIKALKGGLERMRKSYASLAKMQDMVAGSAATSTPNGAQPTDQAQPADPMSGLQAMIATQGEKGAQPDLAATMAMMQGMMQQMGGAQLAAQAQTQPQVQQLDPNLLKSLTKIEQQNNELIQRLSRIQTYLTGLHQYLGQMRPTQQQAPGQAHAQQAPAPAPAQQRTPTSATQRPRQ